MREAKEHRAAKTIVLFCGVWVLFMIGTPIASFSDPFSTVIYDRDGVLLGASIARDQQWRFPGGGSVPPKFSEALETFEDRRFRHHPGVDVIALCRALYNNLRSGEVLSGASTVTMQVVRLARKGKPRTYREKLIEILWALRLEMLYSKDQIMALYAANAPFGGNVVGLEAAAWRYFHQQPEHLSWAENATLAVLPNSPALIHPGRNRERLLQKRNALLKELEERSILPPLTAQLARAEPLPPRPFPMPQLAPHVFSNLPSEVGTVTTLEADVQALVTGILLRHHQQLRQNGIHNAAALVLNTATGEALAYVGNIPRFGSPEHHNFVDVIQAQRSTGSLLKPFLFAGAIQSGELLPNQLLKDVPIRFGGFAPENFSRTYDGAVPASSALTRSLNVPAVRLLRSYGTARFKKTLEAVGLTTLHRKADDYGLSLILGGAEGTLWDLTGAYASLGRTLLEPYVHNPDRSAFFPPALLPRRGDPESKTTAAPLGPGAAYVTLQTLLEVRRPGVDGQWSAFASNKKIAWKTGTSFGHRDSWAIGVSPEFTVGIWAGNADGEGRPNLTGSKVAAPILFDVFDVLGPTRWFYRPEHALTAVRVCAHSGFRAGPHCKDTRLETTSRHTSPAAPCSFCRPLHSDQTGEFRVHARCQPVGEIKRDTRFVLPPEMEWFYRRTHHSYEGLPPLRADCAPSASSGTHSPLSILSPANGAQVLIPRELNGARHGFVVKAAHHQVETRLFWHLDERFLGTTLERHQMTVNAEVGKHRLTLVDPAGHSATLRFEVLQNPAEETI